MSQMLDCTSRTWKLLAAPCMYSIYSLLCIQWWTTLIPSRTRWRHSKSSRWAPDFKRLSGWWIGGIVNTMQDFQRPTHSIVNWVMSGDWSRKCRCTWKPSHPWCTIKHERHQSICPGARLPPCQDALITHIQWMNYRVACYKRAVEPIFWRPKPYDEGQGWQRTEGGILESVWSCLPILHQFLIDLLADGVISDADDDDDDKKEEDDMEFYDDTEETSCFDIIPNMFFTYKGWMYNDVVQWYFPVFTLFKKVDSFVFACCLVQEILVFLPFADIDSTWSQH